MARIDLGSEDKAFTRGGNRLCFVDPRDSSKCIKVLRPDRTPEIRRRQKGFPKSLRSLNSFNENLQEYKVWQEIEKGIGAEAFSYITRCYGFVDTNYGQGLVMDLVCDKDQKISKTLKQYLWEYGLTSELEKALDRFAQAWQALAIPSKKLLLHNMLLKYEGSNEYNIFVIDGLGWSSIIPIGKYVKFIAKKRASKKIVELRETIGELLVKKQADQNFGYHGWMNESQRVIVQNDKD